MSNRVDIISMSWTIKPNVTKSGDEARLASEISKAEQAGVILFRASEDKGQQRNRTGEILPAESTLLRRIGSCNRNGNVSDFVKETEVHYLFPGEQLPAMRQHREKAGNNTNSTDKGSSASTALASGLASLVLWCAVRSGGKKSRFANKRMYALFNKLRVDQTKASLVDVSDLMDEVRAQAQSAHKIVVTFVKRLDEKIPAEIRQYEEEEQMQKDRAG